MEYEVTLGKNKPMLIKQVGLAIYKTEVTTAAMAAREFCRRKGYHMFDYYPLGLPGKKDEFHFYIRKKGERVYGIARRRR